MIVQNVNYALISEGCGDESKRTRTVLCANEATMEIVADYLCGDQQAKPNDEEVCKGKPCKVLNTHLSAQLKCNSHHV